MKFKTEYIFLVLVLIVFILFIKRSTSYANASKVAVSTSIPAPPPSNCSYSKVNAPNAACNAPCGSTGTIPQIYQITKPAVGSGTCPVTNGSAAPGTPCAGTPCPVPCQYATVNAPNASCNAPCGGSGTIAQVYNITSAATNGGTCSVTQGAPAPARACTGSACSPPQNCSFTPWSNTGSCSAVICGVSGKQTQTRGMIPALYGGTPCPANSPLIQTVPCMGPPCYPPPPSPPAQPSTIYGTAVAPAFLRPDMQIVSTDLKHSVTMQSDGNLVIKNGSNAIWALQNVNVPCCIPGRYAAIQADGNFVIYNANGGVAYASNTKGATGVRLTMQNDGNLVLYDYFGRVQWATATNGK